MIAVRIESQCDKLNERRREIARTLDHVRGEQRLVHDNRQWIARSAYINRCNLLDSLIRWYADETRRIDAALRRISEGQYGICLQCDGRIDEQRLETCPEAVLCASCQQAERRLRSA